MLLFRLPALLTTLLLAAPMLPTAAQPATQQPAPADASPAVPAMAFPNRRAAERFPQPVQAGALIGREALRPVEQQQVLGRVAGMVRRPDGALLIVVDVKAPGWRGWLGVGASGPSLSRPARWRCWANTSR